ncbi:unnamed protein product [Durusdinium trenchii]|uniref:Helicase ATP-binding domain-containing protein n=1 Tax=Durusdinium trenchii TaxID=1381693 RepID=A0ABP0QXG2_9DINO
MSSIRPMARAIATPQRGPHVADLVELEQSLEAAKQLLQKLGHLQGPARQDLLRRLKPEFQAWQEQWDTDDGALEPEEDLSEEEYWDSDGDGQDIKKARRAPPALTDDYPMVWGQHLPGYAGFNQKAQECLRSLASWRSSTQGHVELLPQQKVVANLVHPRSPVARLLVDHNTGSGKTLCMIRVLDNFFFDARAKIVIFPKDTVVDNFYSSLWEWPSRWRDYCCQLNQEKAALACGHSDWRAVRFERWCLAQSSGLQAMAQRKGLSLHMVIKVEMIATMRQTLEMKRAVRSGAMRQAFVQKYWQSMPGNEDVHPPAAPLRAYRFTSAGGRAAEVVDGFPRACIFKVGFNAREANPYSNKVILLDEAHHLTRPNKLYQQ